MQKYKKPLTIILTVGESTATEKSADLPRQKKIKHIKIPAQFPVGNGISEQKMLPWQKYLGITKIDQYTKCVKKLNID